jgi:cephalosporin-C deacetylase-like acetyl esterase
VRRSFLYLVLIATVFGQLSMAQDKVDGYQLQFGIKIPLRDGVKLNATLYKPVHATGPLPVIVLLTPYPDNTDHPSGSYFARRGYIFAYVDVRGRGDSEGVFSPWLRKRKMGSMWSSGLPDNPGRMDRLQCGEALTPVTISGLQPAAGRRI